MSEAMSTRAALARAAARLGTVKVETGSLVVTFLERVLPKRRLAGSVAALREAGLVDPETLARSTPEELAAVAGVPAGSSRQWARRLIELAAWIVGNEGEFEIRSTDQLREELRALPGIGAALADALLRDGLGRVAYPVDRGSFRVLVRHGWIEPETSYDEAREAAESLDAEGASGASLRAVQEGLGLVARKFCRPNVAHCEECPLREWLPEGGPRYYEDAESVED